MKKEQTNKKPLIAIVLIAIVGIIGGTIAIFSNRLELTNKYTTAVYHSEYIDKTPVNPGTDPVEPGGQIDIEKGEIENTGDIDLAVRISYTEEWKSQKGATLPNQQDGKNATILNLVNTAKWKATPESGTTYYYYFEKLEPGEKTVLWLDGMSFNPEIVDDIKCTTESVPEGTKYTCNSTGDGYGGATYTLTTIIETVQFDAYKEFWSTSVTINP